MGSSDIEYAAALGTLNEDGDGKGLFPEETRRMDAGAFAMIASSQDMYPEEFAECDVRELRRGMDRLLQVTHGTNDMRNILQFVEDVALILAAPGLYSEPIELVSDAFERWVMGR